LYGFSWKKYPKENFLILQIDRGEEELHTDPIFIEIGPIFVEKNGI
jgi:hypothetical protein